MRCGIGVPAGVRVRVRGQLFGQPGDVVVVAEDEVVAQQGFVAVCGGIEGMGLGVVWFGADDAE